MIACSQAPCRVGLEPGVEDRVTLPAWLNGGDRRTWLWLVLGLTIVAIPAATWAAGGTRTGVVILLAVPVVVAGAALGKRAGAWTGLAAGALAAFVPFSVDLGTAQSPSRSAFRLVTFVLVGWFVGYVRAGLLELARSRSRFLSTVSHELRTPLTSIVGYSEILHERRHELGDPAVVEMVEHLRRESFQMSHTLDQMLVAARIDTGSLPVDAQRVDLRATLQEVLEHLPPIGPPFDVDVEGAAVAVADRLRVTQILRNLVVHVSQVTESATADVVISSNGEAVVELTYTGDSLLADPTFRLFAPLFSQGPRVDMQVERWLPLTVSKQLARLMGGDLDHSSDGTTSTFRLLLPAS